MKADVLLVAPERDNEWPSPDAVRRIAKKLEESSYPCRVQTIVYPEPDKVAEPK